MATHIPKWYSSRTGITMGTGSTLTLDSGATLTSASYSASAPATLDVTGAATVGTTLNVVGDFTVATNKFKVTAASGNTAVAGTLGVTSDFAVNTTYFTVAAATGNTVAKGTANLQKAVTIGVPAAAKAIIIDPAGSKTAPATSMCQIYYDGSDLYACNAANATAKLTASWA